MMIRAAIRIAWRQWPLVIGITFGMGVAQAVADSDWYNLSAVAGVLVLLALIEGFWKAWRAGQRSG